MIYVHILLIVYIIMNKLHIISEKTVFLTGGAKGEQA